MGTCTCTISSHKHTYTHNIKKLKLNNFFKTNTSNRYPGNENILGPLFLSIWPFVLQRLDLFCTGSHGAWVTNEISKGSQKDAWKKSLSEHSRVRMSWLTLCGESLNWRSPSDPSHSRAQGIPRKRRQKDCRSWVGWTPGPLNPLSKALTSSFRQKQQALVPHGPTPGPLHIYHSY